MTDEHTLLTPDRPPRARTVPESPARETGIPTTKPIEQLLEHLKPAAAFGQPVQAGRATVIPVAEVRTGFGFGGGQGRSAKPTSDQMTEEGGGGGGGAGARIVPRGYLYIADEQVHFEPIVDVTRLALAAMGLAAWITFAVSKALQR